jgi:hypothetical protein
MEFSWLIDRERMPVERSLNDPRPHTETMRGRDRLVYRRIFAEDQVRQLRGCASIGQMFHERDATGIHARALPLLGRNLLGTAGGYLYAISDRHTSGHTVRQAVLYSAVHGLVLLSTRNLDGAWRLAGASPAAAQAAASWIERTWGMNSRLQAVGARHAIIVAGVRAAYPIYESARRDNIWALAADRRRPVSAHPGLPAGGRAWLVRHGL